MCISGLNSTFLSLRNRVFFSINGAMLLWFQIEVVGKFFFENFEHFRFQFNVFPHYIVEHSFENIGHGSWAEFTVV